MPSNVFEIWLRRWCIALSVLATVAVAAPARADVQACVDAHSEGQLLRDESKFLLARERFQTCLEAGCPEPIRVECGSLLGKLDELMPSVVLTAHDAQGGDVTDVEVELDGKPFATELTGRAVPVDPGSHTFVFRRRSDGAVATTKVLIVESTKRRTVSARFAGAAEPPSPSPSDAGRADSGIDQKTLAYILAAGGAVALGSFTYFGLSGRARHRELQDTCAPRCAASDASSVSTRYLLADISLVAAAGLLGAGVYFYVTAPAPAEADASGWVAGVNGRF